MIAEFHAHKRGTTDWLNETITERYPLLVEAASKQLIAEAIAKMDCRGDRQDGTSDH